jgi:hypothetical protein
MANGAEHNQVETKWDQETSELRSTSLCVLDKEQQYNRQS